MGRELRIQQQHRSGAALSLAHERPGRRGGMDQYAVDVPHGLHGFVVQQRGRHAGLGQSAAIDRRRRAPGARADGAVAVQLIADGERRRLYEVRPPDPADRIAVVRLVGQRRTAAAVHDQQRAAIDCVAAGDRRGRGADGRHQREPRVASGRRVAAQRSLPPLRLLQRDARHRDRPVRQLRLRGLDELDRRAQAAGARP